MSERGKWMAMAAAVAIVVAATANVAQATTPAPTQNQMRVCLLGDMTGLVDRLTGTRATAAEWALRGIRAEVRVASSGAIVVSSRFVDPDDGCFLMTVPFQATGYEIRVRVRTEVLPEGNVLEIRRADDTVPLIIRNAGLGGAGSTHEVVFSDNDYIRMYAVYAYAIGYRWRGDYENQTLRAVLEGGRCSTPNSACSSGGERWHHIADWGARRKFLMIHEYGHSNLTGADARAGGSNCGGDGHGMRTNEHASCAAMEGWAHAVAAEVFNDYDHSDGEFHYWTSGDEFLTLESGTGECGTGYPAAYAFTCLAEPTLPQRGTELDWMRMLWDYRRNPATDRTPAEMQALFRDTDGWTDGNVYYRIRDTLSGSARSSWTSLAAANGLCYALLNATTC